MKHIYMENYNKHPLNYDLCAPLTPKEKPQQIASLLRKYKNIPTSRCFYPSYRPLQTS